MYWWCTVWLRPRNNNFIIEEPGCLRKKPCVKQNPDVAVWKSMFLPWNTRVASKCRPHENRRNVCGTQCLNCMNSKTNLSTEISIFIQILSILLAWIKIYKYMYGIVVWYVIYRQVSNISRTLVGNKIVDHSDVVGASPVGAAPTTSSFST